MGAEGFSLGVELSIATDDREPVWRELADEARTLFSGTLLYAANWGEEFERLEFWDAFDFVGVDNYYPLTSASRPSDRQLRAGADRVVERLLEVQRRFDRPLLLTETGFASGTAPWVQPHAGDKVEGADPEGQARSYDALFGAMEPERGFAGALIWNWPSNTATPSSRSRSFSPLGKPAEALIGTWFERLARAWTGER